MAKKKSLREVFDSQVRIHLDTNGNWCGTYTMPDNYDISFSCAPGSKKNTCRAQIKEALWERANELAKERNIAVVKVSA